MKDIIIIVSQISNEKSWQMFWYFLCDFFKLKNGNMYEYYENFYWYVTHCESYQNPNEVACV